MNVKIGPSFMTALATTLLVVGLSGCGGGAEATGQDQPPSTKAALVDLPSPTATPTDNSATEAAAKEQADAAAAVAAAKAKADAAAKAKAAAAAKAKAKADAAAKAKADAAAKAKADAAAKARAAAAAAAQEEASTNVYYENCSAVRAAGADPIRRGDAGYSTKLDRDGDGVGCE
jgi:colicin import membrane protein